MNFRIIIIGAGNLGTQLGVELKNKGFDIIQVYSRTESSAKNLSEKIDVPFTIHPEQIENSADVYFIALKDSVINNILQKIHFSNNLLIHCAGSIPMLELKKYSMNYGVLYPVQTFTKERKIDFKEVPLCIEANSEKNLSIIEYIASSLSSKIYHINSEQRKQLHIAAVFTCNFVNHLFHISDKILTDAGINFEILKTLASETTEKAFTLKPFDAQTGPAIRYDKSIIEKHLNILSDRPEIMELYEMISKQIFDQHKK